MSINQGAFQPGSAGAVVSKEISYEYNSRVIHYDLIAFGLSSDKPFLKWQKVELGISARNLVDADVFSKSDPMVVVEQQVRIFNFFIQFHSVGISSITLGAVSELFQPFNVQMVVDFWAQIHWNSLVREYIPSSYCNSILRRI